MSVLFALTAAASLTSDASARKHLADTCTPLKEHLGVFGDAAVAHLKADGKESAIHTLLNKDAPVRESERVTFFMPSGAQAEKTFIDLERGRIGPSASAFTDVTLGEVIRNHIVGSYIPELPTSDTSFSSLASLSSLESHVTSSGDIAVEASHTNVEAHVATGPGVQTCVGMVHSIDNVLVPNSILCSEPFGQCGGGNWRGATCCAQKADQAYACETRDRFWASCRPVKTTTKINIEVEEAEDVPRVVDIPEHTDDEHQTALRITHEDHDDGHAHAHPAVAVPVGHTNAPDVTTTERGEVEVVAGEAASDVESPEVPNGGRIVGEVKPDAVAGDEAATAEPPDIEDVYVFFEQKDYIPDADGDQVLQIEDMEGVSKTVASQEECAQFCSTTDGCNAASYYVDGSKYGGKNCWLKTADFEASAEASSCVLPDDAVDDDNAVLLFLLDDTCERVEGTDDHFVLDCPKHGEAGHDHSAHHSGACADPDFSDRPTTDTSTVSSIAEATTSAAATSATSAADPPATTDGSIDETSQTSTAVTSAPVTSAAGGTHSKIMMALCVAVAAVFA